MPPTDHRPLAVQRELFDIPDDVAYFNCASLAPLLRAAVDAGAAATARRARPWLTGGGDWFADAEERRALFAELAGLDPEGVALVPATSYGLAVAAANLSARPGQRILVLAGDYPSNTYTWRRFARRTGAEVVAVDRRDGQSWGEAVVAALDERVAVVAVLATHWTDGGSVDLAAVGARARDAGAALVVDASQALGAVPLDWRRVQPDYLVTVGYKWLLGPFALGYLYVAEPHRDGVPLEENWISRLGSDDFAALDRLPGPLPAGGAPLRRRPAHPLRDHPDGRGRPPPAARLGGPADRRHPRPAHRPHPARGRGDRPPAHLQRP